MPIINTIEGNLITLAQQGRYTEIGHGANCFCVFGAGIAPQIAKAFPEAEAADNTTIKGDDKKLGSLTVGLHHTGTISEGTTLKILNMYTQYGTKGRAKGEPDIDYHALARSFTILNGMTKEKKERFPYKRDQLMGIPMIGAGLAGGHWEAIKTIIDLVTPDIAIELVVYKP